MHLDRPAPGVVLLGTFAAGERTIVSLLISLFGDDAAGGDEVSREETSERRFANDDVTGQQFLDASIVRLDGSRTEVRLSED